MLTLRQEAMQIVNDIPDNFLVELVKNLKNFQFRATNNNVIEEKENTPTMEEMRRFINSDTTHLDPKKAAAFASLEKWRKQNRGFLHSIDPKKERAAAMEEKYGPID